MGKQIYMVMRLNTEIIQTTWQGDEHIKLEGCAGYIPVFNTLKQAEKSAKDKYAIVPIRIAK